MDMLVAPTGLLFQYIDQQTETAAGLEQPLVKILFDSACNASATQGAVSTGLPVLAGAAAAELFMAGGVARRGASADCLWAETDDYLVLAYWAKESASGGLQQATKALYTRLLSEIGARGYPNLVRVWNYFADINQADEGLERYRQFCIGRFDAFAAQGIAENQFPSACALGHRAGDLLVYALASKQAPQHFENPRQEKAYHYPREYGPRSPSFARASLLPLSSGCAKVFVSGTASVVGHVTLHPDNLDLQIKVTLENLDCLLAHIQADYQRAKQSAVQLRPEILKVYVRHERDVPSIEAQVARAYPGIPAVYVAADICRADLLLEIDGVWNLSV